MNLMKNFTNLSFLIITLCFELIAQYSISANLSDFSSDRNVPIISMVSESTFPNETMVITGWGLKGTELLIRAGGVERLITPLMTENDKMMAVVPNDFPVAVTQIIPVKGKIKGEPYTINAPEAWWHFPAMQTVSDNRNLSVFGRNLVLKGSNPEAQLMQGSKNIPLYISESTPYKLCLQFPSLLKSGKYLLMLKNSKSSSWFKSIEITVDNSTTRQVGTRQVNASAFGALANDGKDDYDALTKALDALKPNGVTLLLDAGIYELSRPIVINTANIIIKGQGKGVYNRETQQVENQFTLLTYTDVHKLPSDLIRVEAPKVTITKIAAINGNSGNKENAIGIYAPKADIHDVNLVLQDKRDWGFEELGPKYGVPNKIDLNKSPNPINECGALYIEAYGQLDMVFYDSEVHTAGPGMLVGKMAPYNREKSVDPVISNIKVNNVGFYGYYTGEPFGYGKKSNVGSGRSAGIILFNARNVDVEHCKFQGANRAGGRYLGRTVLSLNTSNTNLNFANNVSEHVSPHTSVLNIDHNQGEQYLFHYRYPYGGMFHVLTADLTSLTFNAGDYKTNDEEPFEGSIHFIDDSYSRVLKEVGTNDDWYVYIFSGKGAGQYRQVKSRKDNNKCITFSLDKPWKVAPDSSSRVHLTSLYRHIVLNNNVVDTKELIKDYKSHGVCFWFYSMDNIVANNQFRNLTSGVVFNSHYRGETGWNLTVGNLVENVDGYSGDTSLEPSGYCDHFRIMKNWPAESVRGWYEVGNIARNNIFKNVKVGAFIHGRYEFNDSNRPFANHSNSGIVMSVIENNIFYGLNKGIILGNPANLCLIRNNMINFNNNIENRTPVYIEPEIRNNNISIDNQLKY